mgnify:CR=1 FL=1
MKFYPEKFRELTLPWMPPEDANLLVVEILAPCIQNIHILVKALNESAPLPDFLLIYSPGEPSDYDYIEAVLSITNSYGITRVGIYDAGMHLYEPRIKHFPASWLGLTGEVPCVDPVPYHERTTKFCCLNRVARPHRIKLVEEVYRQSLDKDGLISCGPGNPTYNFDAYAQPEWLHLFPLQGDNMGADADTAAFSASTDVMNCLVNLIPESSIEKVGTHKQCWERAMLTEKTVKAYMFKQLPIWFAPQYFVKYQQDLGFDVFDDIIDHNRYDRMEQPYDRIHMIVGELKKLVNRPIEELQQLMQSLDARLEENRSKVARIYQSIELESGESLKNWLGYKSDSK